MCLAVWKALTVVVTPLTIEVVAPLTIAPDALAVSAEGGDAVSTVTLLTIAQDSNQSSDARTSAVAQLTSREGSHLAQGQEVFKRVCAACHKMHGEGADYAPDLTDVTKRLTREKIIESIVNPNAVVEEKYKTTMIMTIDGDVFTGLLTGKENGQVTLFDGKISREIDEEDIEEMQTKDLSSMPERQADAMTPDEFLNLVEYLSQPNSIE